MLCREKDYGDPGQAHRRANRADEKQRLASNPVNDRHSNNGEEQIGPTHCHGLQVPGHYAELCMRNDVIQVIKDGVDSSKLIDNSNAYRQEDRKKVIAMES